MSDEIKVYHSLAELYGALGGALAADELPFAAGRLETLHPAPMASPLFRANYYSIVIVRSGGGRYLIDSHSYETRPGTIYFTNPGHIKGFELRERTEGYVITFAESFLKRYVHVGALDEFPFLIAEIAPPQYVDPPVLALFDGLAGQLLEEFGRPTRYRAQLIGALTRIILLKIKELFWNAYDPLDEAGSGSQIVAAFKRNLEAHVRDLAAGRAESLGQVQDFARLQQLHPNYFSTVIKRKTGKPVQAWIAEKLVAEAQALLARSPLAVQEIAALLAFKESGHFARFFKKHTGLTPSAFRAAQRG